MGLGDLVGEGDPETGAVTLGRGARPEPGGLGFERQSGTFIDDVEPAFRPIARGSPGSGVRRAGRPRWRWRGAPPAPAP